MQPDKGPLRLDSMLEGVRQEQEQPAIVAAVVHGSQLLAIGAAGVRVLGTTNRVTLEDRFHIGSITKPMTATVIAALVKEGALGWKTTILDVLSDETMARSSRYSHVTIEQLLRHRSGLPPYTHITDDSREELLLRSLRGTPQEQRRQFSVAMLREEPISVPGTEMHYSNAGYTIAAHIAETLVGVQWESIMKKYLFAPLGMMSAAFGWPATAECPCQPWGHRKDEEQKRLCPYSPEHPYQLGPAFAASGDVHCTIGDLALFVISHIQGYQGKSELLDQRTVRYLHTPQDGYGLGWNVQNFSAESLGLANETMSSAAGSAGTFFAQVVILHGCHAGFAVAVNSGTGEKTVALVPGLLMKEYLPSIARNSGESAAG